MQDFELIFDVWFSVFDLESAFEDRKLAIFFGKVSR